MFVNISDMPRWAREEIEQVLGQGKRPECKVEAAKVVSFGAVWHDACRRVLVAWNGKDTLFRQSCYGRNLINATGLEFKIHQGGEIVLPQAGCALLEVLTYPQRATLYVHPDDMPKWLEGASDDVGEFDKWVLDTFRAYTSKGRRDQWARCGVSKRVQLARLQEAGLLTNGQHPRLTTAGKNAVEQERKVRGFTWADTYGYKLR